MVAVDITVQNQPQASMQMNKCVYVSVKLYFKKWAAGHIWPVGGSFASPCYMKSFIQTEKN